MCDKIKEQYPYLYETHLHTLEGSACAHCTAKEMVKACKAYGYTGIFVTDHNWGGSGMIGMQEMLMQEVDGRVILFPAWPKNWDVTFRLRASGNRVVEATMKDGKVENVRIEELGGLKN